jgi:Ca2+-binding RTX toxin-like protein
VLRGRRGADLLTGGTGPDFFAGGPGHDTATDFDVTEGDTQNGSVP